jgi:hypothetical protein
MATLHSNAAALRHFGWELHKPIYMKQKHEFELLRCDGGKREWLARLGH